jgi:hypothetical protein
MKRHFISLFDPVHRWWTMSFFIASIILIVTSILVSIDNTPGFAILFVGMIILFFAIVHPWRDVSNYVILISVCIGIILLLIVVIGFIKDTGNDIGKTEYFGETIIMGLFFFICLPGIVVGIIGSIICSFINN